MNILSELLPPIQQNLFGFDALIILMALGTLAYFIYILRHADKVHNVLYTQGYLPDDVYDEEEPTPPSKAEIKKQKIHLRTLRETTEKYYSMFVNLTGIFPLMGILGTVISLIPLVQDMDNMQANFFVALTSTLWGLIFAVTFRLLDGVLQPRLERNNRGIDDYLEKLETKLGELRLPPREHRGHAVEGLAYDSKPETVQDAFETVPQESVLELNSEIAE